MWRLVKISFWFALLAGLALTVYAYLGPILMPHHFVPAVTEVNADVELDLD
jgi:hypothetical protein